MDFKGWFLKGWEMVKLNRDAAAAVAEDEKSFGPAVLFIAIGGLAAGLGGAAFSGGVTLVAAPFGAVILSFVWVGILHLIAMLFGGKASYKAYYSALGVGSIPNWAGIVPVVGGLVSLWCIPVAVIVTERVHGLSLGKAVAVVLIPVVFLLVVGVVLVALGLTAMFMGMSGMHGM